jgi:tetratricopeptide (TPR) repeat protein
LPAGAQVGPPVPAVGELLSGKSLGLGPELPEIVSADEVMELTDEMQGFLDQHINPNARDAFKLNQLIYAVITRASFGLTYDDKTRTPAETFSARSGNCLSFTYLFVVLARGVGLDARFQEVDIPPDWSFDSDTYVLNRHINIHVKLDGTRDHVVDFNIENFQGDYETEVISDRRALAHFFNNLGAELLKDGDTAGAFHAFTRAIVDNDREFSPAWANLGALYSRNGLDNQAEQAYLQALELDKRNYSAMSNLTALYDRRGDSVEAERYRNKVRSHRRQNPYYRYHLARVAFYAGEYDFAIDHLKYAIREQRDEDRFLFLLGLVYMEKGDAKRSLRYLTRAENVAKSEARKAVYSSKIRRLQSSSG